MKTLTDNYLTIKIFCLIAAAFICSSCNKSSAETGWIAKDPLAVVQIKSFDSLLGVLPEAAKAQADGIKAMFPDLKTSESVSVVMTSVNPFAAYAVVPYNESSEKLLGQSPYKDKAVDKGGVVLVPLAGELPAEFAPSEGDKGSIVDLTVDIALIKKTSGDYLQKKLSEQMNAITGMMPADEPGAKLTKASMDLNVKMLDMIFNQSDTISISYTKSDKHKISASWKFTKGSEFAKANAELASMDLKTHPDMEKMPIFMSASIDYEKAKPMFEPIMKLTDDLYKAMGLNMDIASMMENFYKIGESDMVMGMSMDMASQKMDMSSVVVSKNKPDVLKASMDKWLETISSAPKNELMSFKKTDEKFKSNDVYLMQNSAAPGTNLTMTLSSTDKGLLYASDVKGLEKLYGIDLKPLGKKGIMLMKIDLSKMTLPGVPPVNAVVNALMYSEGSSAKMEVSF